MLFAATLAAGLSFFGGWPTACAENSQIVTVREGEPAPFSGDLYPVELSLKFAFAIEGCEKRKAAEVHRITSLHGVELAKLKALAQASAEAEQRRTGLLRAQLDEANAWYRSTPFVVAVSVASTVAVLLTATIILDATAEVVR